MSNDFYLARQPILNAKQEIIAYELLYRDSEVSAAYANERHATAALLVNVLNQADFHNVIGNALAFVNIDDRFLRHEIVDTIPPQTFIFEITSSSALDELTVERIEVLHKKGYHFCLDVTEYKDLNKYKKLFHFLSYCKVDSSSFDAVHIADIAKLLHSYRIQAIATKLENVDLYEKYKESGFDAFQGYYFAKPNVIHDKRLDTDKLSLFKLCDLLQSGGDMEEIVEAFKNSPGLTLQLLRFMNSASFHFKNRISSIHQVITLLGRNALVQWLMLLLYAKPLSSELDFGNPLIVMVKQRTDLMGRLLKMTKSSSTQREEGEAYFVGIFSLMEALFRVPLKNIVSEFNLDESVTEALEHKKGNLGELYTVVLAIENFETDKIDAFISKHAIDKAAFEKMMLETIRASAEFSRTSV
jgi:EAL and modified HD-GYP domain-containing signal transduction protein